MERYNFETCLVNQFLIFSIGKQNVLERGAGKFAECHKGSFYFANVECFSR